MKSTVKISFVRVFKWMPLAVVFYGGCAPTASEVFLENSEKICNLNATCYGDDPLEGSDLWACVEEYEDIRDDASQKGEGCVGALDELAACLADLPCDNFMAWLTTLSGACVDETAMFRETCEEVWFASGGNGGENP